MAENVEAKTVWLKDLAKFIVEANKNTWAADAPEVAPQRPGYKELEYRSTNGLWLLRDSYTGYFRAPGMTTVYYKYTPSWAMSYGGKGMVEAHYEIVKPTYEFLKQALMRVTPDLPFRGPFEFVEGNRKYTFKLDGDIEDCTWVEEITENGDLTFTQNGFAGTIIHRSPDRKPQYSWNL